MGKNRGRKQRRDASRVFQQLQEAECQKIEDQNRRKQNGAGLDEDKMDGLRKARRGSSSENRIEAEDAGGGTTADEIKSEEAAGRRIRHGAGTGDERSIATTRAQADQGRGKRKELEGKTQEVVDLERNLPGKEDGKNGRTPIYGMTPNFGMSPVALTSI